MGIVPPRERTGPNRKKVGLALSSGAVLGLAHVGVIEILEKNNIPIDLIAGTSMGAIVGALYASGKTIAQITTILKDLRLRKLMSMVDLAIPTRGFIRGKRLDKWLKSNIGNLEFTDLKLPFACMATDITTGEDIYIDRGPVAPAVRASSSIPVIFTPAKWQGRYLVDGALVKPIPVRALKDMGADILIAVNVLPYLNNKQEQKEKNRVRAPSIMSVVIRMIYILGYQAAQEDLSCADIVITPEVGHIFPASFHRANECIIKGKQAAELAIPEIKKALES